MIADYLDRSALLTEFRAKRNILAKTLKNHASESKAGEDARKLLSKHAINPKDLPGYIALLDTAMESIRADKQHPVGSAFIPSHPLVCALQAGMTQRASEDVAKRLKPNRQPVPKVRGGAAVRAVGAAAKPAIDTSAPHRLASKAETRMSFGGFIENDDVYYALKGIKAKASGLMNNPRPFNHSPARTALTDKPLSLYIFGDWGTGLPLARRVTQSIYRQIQQEEPSTQSHVIHLGDVYYIGEKEEYEEYLLNQDCWPIISPAEINAIGSWSLNGNHDRYSGGYGYFDTLLRDSRFIRWHADKDGNPSSFFLIENSDWQVFGLDTSWNLPTLGEAVTEEAWTTKDYAGSNGILTQSQVDWMQQERARSQAKGCILLTHHQPAASRRGEDQHANETVKALQAAGLYDTIDAWIWGHEHRAVVFRQKGERTHPKLKEAPSFICCLGHAGVPVTKKNFAGDKTIGDVTWQEDRLGSDSPMYEKQRVVPFGFGKLETNGPNFLFTVFDHDNSKRFQIVFRRGQGWTETFRAAAAAAPSGRSAVAKKPAKTTKKAARAVAKKSAKRTTKKAAGKGKSGARTVTAKSTKPAKKKNSKKRPARR